MSDDLGRDPKGSGLLPSAEPHSVSGHSPCDPSRGQWRPIATAPKDGTKICLAEYHDGGRYPDEARWNFWTDHWRKYFWEGEGFGQPRRASHWMPLPTPPAQGIEARSAETQGGSVEDESPVTAGHAPAPKREGETQQKETAA